MDPRNFEVLGIRLGTSTVGDIKQILGPAPENRSQDPENSIICYASRESDRTILEFENWTDPMEFRLFRGSPEEVKRCALSDHVSASVSTASGLRLALSRSQVLALLGQPTKVQGSHLLYEFSDLRPLNKNEQERASKVHPSPTSVEVYEKIDLQFTAASAVTKIDIIYSESW